MRKPQLRNRTAAPAKPRFNPGLEHLELRPLMSFPAIVLPSYVYGSAYLGSAVQADAVLLSKPGTQNGDIVNLPAAGLSEDDSYTTLNFDDNNSGESTTAFMKIETFADNSDGDFSDANALGYTTLTPSLNPPGQNFIPVLIEPSNGSVDGQQVSVELNAVYMNTNIYQTSGSNTYAVEYKVGASSPVLTMMNGVDSQLPAGGQTYNKTATFTATVGQKFYVFVFLESSTDDGAPQGSIELDITATDDGGGGGGGGGGGDNPPTAVNHLYATSTGTPLLGIPPGVLDGDTDPNGLSLSVASYTQPSDGTLTVNTDGAFNYAPDPGFSGTDSFKYEIEDTAGLFATGTVTIVVQPRNPVATHWAILGIPPDNVTANSQFSLQAQADDNGGNLVNTFDTGPATILLSTNEDPSPNGRQSAALLFRMAWRRFRA